VKKRLAAFAGTVRRFVGRLEFRAEYSDDGRMWWTTDWGSYGAAKACSDARKEGGTTMAVVVMRWTPSMRVYASPNTEVSRDSQLD